MVEAGGAIIAGGAILYWGCCKDETPSGPQFTREWSTTCSRRNALPQLSLDWNTSGHGMRYLTVQG